MIASSAAWSTSETKSFCCLRRMVRASRSTEERVMMLPALRAALTAVLSMGCMPDFTMRRLHAQVAAQDLRLVAQLLRLALVHDVAVVDDVDAVRERERG